VETYLRQRGGGGFCVREGGGGGFCVTVESREGGGVGLGETNPKEAFGFWFFNGKMGSEK
jgi:hypothetical protein